MILNLITTIILTSSLSYSPLNIGIIVMSYSLFMLMIITNFMSSLIMMLIFLIYIGGLMVMFSYFLSLHPNFPIDSYPIMFSLILNFTYTTTTNHQFFSVITTKSEKISTILLMSKYEILILLTFSLLFTLVIVSTLLSKFWGPMRPYS